LGRGGDPDVAVAIDRVAGGGLDGRGEDDAEFDGAQVAGRGLRLTRFARQLSDRI
jgi:hypothetical protein